MAQRSRVLLEDYRSISLPPSAGLTLFIGNPPYVRHHLLDSHWKDWLSRQATERGYTASQLAGLHVHFLMAALHHTSEGDYAAFIAGK